MNPTDNELLTSGRLEELWARYEPQANSLAQRMSNIRPGMASFDDLKGIVRVAFMRAAVHFQEGLGAFRPFFRTVLRQHVLDFVRKEAAASGQVGRADRSWKPVLHPEWADLLNGSDGHTPGDAAAASDNLVALWGALRKLPIEQMEALSLLYFGGLTRKAVADTLGIHVNTVDNRVTRAMATLRRRLT